MVIIGIKPMVSEASLQCLKIQSLGGRMEELILIQDIENLNISLTEHSLVITESNDDKIHLQYHPNSSLKRTSTLYQRKVLRYLTPSQRHVASVGSSIEGILFIASGISSRNDEVVLSLPEGRELKDLTAQVDHRILSIANAKLSNAKILSNGYLLRITDSEIKIAN